MNLDSSLAEHLPISASKTIADVLEVGYMRCTTHGLVILPVARTDECKNGVRSQSDAGGSGPWIRLEPNATIKCAFRNLGIERGVHMECDANSSLESLR